MANVCPVCNNPVGPRIRPARTAASSCRVPRSVSHRCSSVKTSWSPPRRPKPTAVLHVVRGPQTGVSFKLGDQKLSIGRSPQCDIFLNDMTVSRTHASVEPVDSGYEISDEASFNGVWVNNNSIDTYLLADGDVVQIGAFLPGVQRRVTPRESAVSDKRVRAFSQTGATWNCYQGTRR